MSAANALPRGFDLVENAHLQAAVRSDLKQVLWPVLLQWAARLLPLCRPVLGGRGGARAIDLEGGLAVVLRPYRRGGLLRHVNKDLYFGLRPRPFRELCMIETLRARKVPTVEPLAAAVRWIFAGCYRGVLISREVPDAVNLWQWLRSAPAADHVRTCAVAAAVTRQLHDAGVVHPDLNLQNYLVRPAVSQPQVLVIDCDRVRIGRVSMGDRRAAVARLYRSAKRLDPSAQLVTGECMEQFRAIMLAEVS